MKLYIHVPFCHSKCAYCDFYSTHRKEWMEAYTDALINEWRVRSETFDEGIDTLYFGGGTPSSLPTALLKRIIDALGLDTRLLREATIEANPEDVSPEWVRFIVNETPLRRVSMGIQSFDDSELHTVGRRHTAARAIEATEILRAEGIANISCDLIYGLPGQDMKSWKRSLSTLTGLRPEHISAYLLSYEPGTRLFAMLDKGKIEETPDEVVEAMYAHLCEVTAKEGYRHYEISNFALPGKEAIHNSSYWDGSPYIGLGRPIHAISKNISRGMAQELTRRRTKRSKICLTTCSSPVCARLAESVSMKSVKSSARRWLKHSKKNPHP
ncbi:radical SAM family heme chaperone HemW [uncultured Duncaniella sp.]|uniref:radical SAM family heme chaperone HemW n=1 Tax=uncultured Duncaniella sp. TaxID=2768039 RepID=UPI0026DFA34A|nr:radical SAM family heme chaperone HemW [uncultured Duncaniella sp.]